ncbi:MAG: replication endonuclease [Aquabacterium sp.]
MRALAERRAALMVDRIAQGGATGMALCALVPWLNGQVKPLQGRPLRANRNADEAEAVKGLLARATCKDWWYRALRKAATVEREAQGRAGQRVCASRQPYITNETMRRKLDQDAANAAMLAATELENEDGQVFSLARLAEVSVSNPAIRRGELMTRIRGCEEWAEAHGMVGIFTTQTAPSRYHAVHRHGAVNEKWIAAAKPTPKHAQQWLCDAWARARAALDRGGFGIFGFRVAEPHHDGTPHWHGLFWCAPENVEAVQRVIKHAWLNDVMDEPCGPWQKGKRGRSRGGRWAPLCLMEPGALEHRFKAIRMEKGGASGYIAKYIAKGIDDEGAVGMEGHDDEIQGRVVRMEQGDLFGGGARRVRAWASAHGIRQFQPIGQPPVTVWRELRRVSEAQALMASERIQGMWQAAQREGVQRASWASYMVRQGGAFCGRKYRVQVDQEACEHAGRYEKTTEQKPVGVLDRIEGRRAASDRKEWRPRGAWGARANSQQQRPVKPPSADGGRALAVHPWTRVNNCTGPSARERFPWAFADDWRAAYNAHMGIDPLEPGAVDQRNHHARNFEDPRPGHHRPANRPEPAGHLARPG